MEDTLKTIARVRCAFPTKFGLPRQSGLVEAIRGAVVFEEGYRSPEALRGLEGFSHIWLLWGFHLARREDWSPTVRPPRLGGNTRMGVFATRSPFRPNPVGLSCVRLEGVGEEPGLGLVLYVAGLDMTDGSPVYDIKPYLPLTDCHPEATGGFSEASAGRVLRVEDPQGLLAAAFSPQEREAALGALAQDPRPSYQHDPQRVYGFLFAGRDVRFTVDGSALRVVEVADGGR